MATVIERGKEIEDRIEELEADIELIERCVIINSGRIDDLRDFVESELRGIKEKIKDEAYVTKGIVWLFTIVDIILMFTIFLSVVF